MTAVQLGDGNIPTGDACWLRWLRWPREPEVSPVSSCAPTPGPRLLVLSQEVWSLRILGLQTDKVARDGIEGCSHFRLQPVPHLHGTAVHQPGLP